MIHIKFSNEIKTACPNLQVITIECEVHNTISDDLLWKEIETEEIALQQSLTTEFINKWEPIRATREAYKRLGKDPNRYRPSAEALRRRTVRKIPLYKVDTLVDLIN